MGLWTSAYFHSHFVYYSLVNTVISLVAWALLMINVISFSGGGFNFLYIWLFGESLFGEIVFIQSLFHSTKHSGLFTVVFYFATSFLVFSVYSENTSHMLKAFMSIVP